MAERRNRVTMADIARESGVSLSTVSLVLNDKPGLPPETRSRVISAARQLGYELRSPSMVISKPSLLQTIGVLVKRAQGDTAPPSSNIFFSHVIAGVEAGCRQENISLLYATLPVDDNNQSLEVPRLVNDHRVDGLILVGNYIDDRLDMALRSRGIPVIMVEAYSCNGEFDSILIENNEGAFNATQYLIERGHRHIAFLGSFPDSRISFFYRRQGYRQALQQYGLPNYYFGDCPHNQRDAILQATRRLVTENPQITAILGCNDEVTIIAMHALREMGLRVPDDISMIGFDNNVISEYAVPPLTTLNVDKVGMGRLAVQLMINRAENAEQGFISMRLHPCLVERKSVRDLRQPN